MAGIILQQLSAASQTVPAPTKDNLFFDTDGKPKYKDSSGNVWTLGLDLSGTQTVVTTAGVTTLTKVSPRQTIFTGSSTQTCVMPDATTLFLDWRFELVNLSTGPVTVNTFGGAYLTTLATGEYLVINCTSVSASAGGWQLDFLGQVQPVGVTSTPTAGGTTTLTAANTSTQIFTGTQSQTVVLPNATTIPFAGWLYVIINLSTGPVTVQANGGSTVATVATGAYLYLTNTSTSTAAGTWATAYLGQGQPRGTTSTAMAGSTTTLNMASTRQQIFTGSGTTAQIAVLPDARTLPFIDWTYEFDNNTTGTGALTIQTNGGATLWVVAAGTSAVVNCTSIATAAGTWNIVYNGEAVSSGKVLTVQDNVTFPANAVGGPVNQLGDGLLSWWRGTPVLFGQLNIFGHSYLDMIYGLGNNNPWANQNQDSIDGAQFARLVGGTLGAQVINHCKVAATLTSGTVSGGGYSKVLGEINRSSSHWPFTQADGALLLVFGINDVGNYSSANQALMRSSSTNAYNAIIAKWRSSAYWPVQTGSPLQWTTGANFSNGAAANRDWNGDGKSVVATAVDSAGSSTATFTIPFGYNGEDITFYLIGNNSANACVVTWGGTVTGTSGIVGTTTTINGTTIDPHGVIPVRWTSAANGLAAKNAGQTISVRVTTSTSGTFELLGASIAAKKPNPVLIANVPTLICQTVNFAFGDGVGNGTTTFTSASAAFVNTSTDSDVGGALVEVDAQGKIPSNTTVSSVTNSTTIVANNTIASGTNIQFTVARTINGYKGNYSTNTNFTSATPASHSAADTDVINYNSMLTAVKNGWDTMVGIIDLNAAVGGNPFYFAYDGLHLNDWGQTVFIREFVKGLNALQPINDGVIAGVVETLAGGVPLPPFDRYTRRSGQVYMSPGVVVAGTGVTLATGDMYAIAFPSREDAEMWVATYIEVTTASATTQGTVRVGYYDDDAFVGYPQVLRWDWTSGGAFGYGTTTGVKTVASSQTLTPKPGLWWLVLKVDSAGTSAGVLRAMSGQSPYLPNWSASGGTGGFVAWKLTGQAAGALPGFFPVGAALATTAPIIGIQVNVL